MDRPTCPESIELADWIEGALDPERQADVTRHLRQCPACRFAIGPEGAQAAANVIPGPSTWFGRRMRILPAPRPNGRTSLAAGTESPAGGGLPSVAIDAERSVLHFRVDPASGAVTAYLVCQDAEQQAYRVLLIADRIFATDARGTTALEPLRATDLFGAFVELPEFVAEWKLEAPAEAGSANDRAMLRLGAPLRGSADPATGTYALLPGDSILRLLIELNRPGWISVVCRKQVIFFGEIDPETPLEIAGIPGTATGGLADEVRLLLFA